MGGLFLLRQLVSNNIWVFLVSLIEILYKKLENLAESDFEHLSTRNINLTIILLLVNK